MATKGERTRQRILATARDRLRAGEDTDVAAVAAAAGVSVGGLYHHFEGKTALLAALVEDFHDRFEREAAYAELPDAPDWAARERERLHRAVRFHYEDPLAPVLLVARAADGTVARIDAERLRRTIRASEENLRAAQRAGDLDPELDPALLAAMLMGGLRQVLATALALDPRPPEDELADEVWAMVARVMRL